MKTGVKNHLLPIVFLAVLPISLIGQGTVNFANIGGGVNAPVSGLEGLLGAGYTAQLQLVDGTNIGDPAPFLANGLFSGGSRTVPGVAGGSTANLRVFASNADGSISGASNAFTVTLADPNALPEPEAPAPLLGLVAFELSPFFSVAPTPTPTPTPTPFPPSFFPPSSVNSEEVEIPDPILERDIRIALGKSVGALTLLDMAELTELQVGVYELDTGWGVGPDRRVRSLKGLESATNLTSLQITGLCDNPSEWCSSTLEIQDLSTIDHLTKLEKLNLRGNSLPDLSFLRELQNLKDLDISNCYLTSFSFPKELRNLEKLNLRDNRFDELNFSEAPESLVHLDLRNSKLKDLGSLIELKGLKVLLLACNPTLKDYANLAQLHGITVLEIGGERDTSFEFLSEMPNLTRLAIYSGTCSWTGNALESSQTLDSFGLPVGLSSLQELKVDGILESVDLSNIPPSLSKLDLSGNSLTSLSLTIPNNIEALNLSCNRVRDMAFLDQLPELKDLDLSNNGIREVSLPVEVDGLRRLNLGQNKILELGFLDNLPLLESLELESCDLISVVIPGQLSNLSLLDLSKNQLTALALPAGSKRMRILRLRSNLLRSLKIPEHYLELEELDATANKLRTLALPDALTSLRLLHLRDNVEIRNFALPASLDQLEVLDLHGCGLTNLDFPDSLEKIENIYASANDLSSIELPSDMPNLRDLRLYRNSISNLTLPRFAPKLATLSVSYNKIEELLLPEVLDSITTIEATADQIFFPCCGVPEHLQISDYPTQTFQFYPTISIGFIGDQLEIEWNGRSLETKQYVDDNWKTIDNATNPHSISPEEAQMLFRARL